MSNYNQNQSYHHETAPTEYLQQNYGFSPAYEHQQQHVPPYPTGDEYQRQPPTAPYPTLPPINHPQPMQQSYPAQIVVQPAPVHVMEQQPQHQQQQQPPRIVYVQQRDNSNWCVKLCCECMCAIVSSVVYTVLGIVLSVVVIGLIVYFVKFYKH